MAFAPDLTDRQWALVSDLFDPLGRRGAPARIPRRSMVNAVLYQARTECQWRYLPAEFGPLGAVWQQFRRWRAKGGWVAAVDRLRRAARVKTGRDPEPSMVMLDSQTAQRRPQRPDVPRSGRQVRRHLRGQTHALRRLPRPPVAARVDSGQRPSSRIRTQSLRPTAWHSNGQGREASRVAASAAISATISAAGFTALISGALSAPARRHISSKSPVESRVGMITLNFGMA